MIRKINLQEMNSDSSNIQVSRRSRGISFLVVNYFTSELVINLVNSIHTFVHDYKYEILLFDNSVSVDEHTKLLSIKSEGTNIFSLQENIGFVRANNYLFNKTQYDVLVLINPDTKLIDDSLMDLIDVAYENDDIGILGPMLLDEFGLYQPCFFQFPKLSSMLKEHIFLQKDAYLYKTDNNMIQDCDVIKGACLVINRHKLPCGQLFDPAFEMYSEELDLCRRLKSQSLRVVYYPRAKIIHYGERSSGQKSFTEYSIHHYYRSKLIYFRKYYSHSFYLLIRSIIFLSLIEKTILLALVGRTFSSRIHANVFKKLFLKLNKTSL